MARPETHNASYFPFYCKEGKALYIIEHQYGNDGFAVWVKILRELTVTNDHHLYLGSQIDLSYLASKCLVSDAKLVEIIKTLTELDELDLELWIDYNCLFSQKLADSLEHAYKKRSNDIINKDVIFERLFSKCRHLSGLCNHNSTLNLVNSSLNEVKIDLNTQIKEKKIKEKNSKENISFNHWITDFIEAEKLTELQDKKFSLTYEQCLNLETKYLAQSIKDKLIACTIKPSYTAKITSLSRLLQNWLNKPEHIKQIEFKPRGGALVKSPELFESLEYQQLTD